jgi:2,3-bisphosphoglycerate-independent phosphoglycerate mutase
LDRIAAEGVVGRLAPGPIAEEALLGVSPGVVRLQPGPLRVAALGHDPPERSVHFCLDVLSLADGRLSRPSGSQGASAVAAEIGRLATRSLSLLAGPELEHAMVWDRGSIDLRCYAPEEIGEEEWTRRLPEGDGEPMLRRLIEDSVDLLSGLEANRRREEEGLAPLNVLWPWGPGFREPVPALAIRRGEPLWIESRSWRLAGLARLSGDRHGDGSAFARGLGVRWSSFLHLGQLAVVFAESFLALRTAGRHEEMARLARSLDDDLLAPLLDDEAPLRIGVFAPDPHGAGLYARWESESPDGNTVPLDERALDERRIPETTLWEALDSLYSSPSSASSAPSSPRTG